MAGIKVSRVGFDVNTCADNELLFSSDFPLLKMSSTGTYTVSADVGAVTLETHGLGYYPAYTIYYTTDGLTNQLDPSSGFYITCDNDKLYLDTTVAFGNGIQEIQWTIYRQDLFSIVDYGSLNTTPTSQGVTDDYGIIVSKSGAGILTGDPRQLAIDSRKRSLIIHQVDNVEFISGTVYPDIPSVTHNLGYPPLYFSYEKYESDGLVRQWSDVGGPFNGASDTEIILYTTGAAGVPTNATVSFIVFKDPINLTV